MKKQLNKRTKKHQRGGAASAARASRPSNGARYTQADVDEFCTNLYQYTGTPKGQERIGKNSITQLSSNYFQYRNPSTHDTKISVQHNWHEMIKDPHARNSRGQTILYVALRLIPHKVETDYNDDDRSIKSVIDSIINMSTVDNIIAKNDETKGGDNSIPLHALCNGKIFDESIVNFNIIIEYIKKFVKMSSFKALTTKNNKDETPFDVLKQKEGMRLVIF